MPTFKKHLNLLATTKTAAAILKKLLNSFVLMQNMKQTANQPTGWDEETKEMIPDGDIEGTEK